MKLTCFSHKGEIVGPVYNNRELKDKNEPTLNFCGPCFRQWFQQRCAQRRFEATREANGHHTIAEFNGA